MTLEDLLKEPLEYPRREDVDSLVEEAMRCLPASRADLSSRVSHAIRTPLAAILGFKEVLEMDAGVSEADRETYREIVEGETFRLKRFIESLKLFESLLAGDLKSRRTSQNILSTLHSAVSRCRLDAKTKKVRIELISPPDELMIDADHQRLCLAFEHLLHNAIRATGKNGIIDIEILVNPDQIEIIIEDSGFGMDPAKIDSLFKAFQRIPRPDDNGGELGIGLTIVRSIIEHHQGSVTVTSEPMDGTRISLTLPR